MNCLLWVKSLSLKTVLILSSDDLDESLSSFLKENYISLKVVEHTLITEEMVTESLKVQNKPPKYSLSITIDRLW